MMKQLLFGLIVFVHGVSAYAATTLYHVAPDGRDWPCGDLAANVCGNISAITKFATADDITIKVAVGAYTDTINVDTDDFSVLNVSGGWNIDFSGQVCNPTSTLLNVQDSNAVFYIATLSGGTISVDFSCLKMKGALEINRRAIDLSSEGGSLVFKGRELIFEHIAGSALTIRSLTGASMDIDLQKIIFRDAYQPETSPWGGGAISISAYEGSHQTIKLENSLLYNNSSGQGGAINVSVSDVAPASASSVDL